MCRQFYDASALPVIVLRPDGIMDLRTRSNRGGDVGEYRTGWCCRTQTKPHNPPLLVIDLSILTEPL